MRQGILKALLLWLAAATALVLVQPAQAKPATPHCVAYSDGDIALHAPAMATLDWQCDPTSWEDGHAVIWLRYDADRGHLHPVFSSRITSFDNIAIAAMQRDGTIRRVTYTPGEARPVMAGPVFAVSLPRIDVETQKVIVRIERPHNVMIASEARISSDPSLAHDAIKTTLFIAAVAGMLLMPLLFDINFYVVLRERFVLMHAGMVVAMIGYVLLSGGLISAFATVPIELIAVGGPLCWTAGVAFAAFFLTSFLEPDSIPKDLRRLTQAVGWWTVFVPSFLALQLDATQSFDNTGYFVSLAPALVLYTVVIGWALVRKSRAARFLAAAWLPIIVSSTERLIRGLGLYSAGHSVDYWLFLAIGLEVIFVALGVADRFLAVRRERDNAVHEARSMVELTERDPLTGLLNRRALEMRVDGLRKDGFHTLALVDLDRFKDINDRFGHLMGDDVLRSTAAALALDRNALAFRMGGEEFLLLMRGDDVLTRAERLRQAISTRIASDIPGLDQIVTASVGLIDISSATLPRTDLAIMYERADKLLYDAKEGGRNRMVSESLRTFLPRKADRRRKRASAAA